MKLSNNKIDKTDLLFEKDCWWKAGSCSWSPFHLLRVALEAPLEN